MNALAIIPARGGSKGIERKNLREVGGKPLLVWSIEAALASKLVTRAVVSTEDDEIARVAARAGAKVVRRPAELATDEAATDPVLVHAVKQAQACDHAPELVVLLQPTVPVRAPGLIDQCIDKLIETKAASLLTANLGHFTWHRWKGAKSWSTNSINRPRRQDMPESDLRWHEDGSVYVVRADELLAKRRRVVEPLEILVTERTVDVDSERDLIVADALLRETVHARFVSDEIVFKLDPMPVAVADAISRVALPAPELSQPDPRAIAWARDVFGSAR